MTFEIVRQTLAQKILDTKPVGYVVVLDNDPFDWANPPSVFHHVKISFQGASQIGISPNPKTRDMGFIYLRTHIREQVGSRPATEAMQWLKDQLAFKILSATGVRVTLEALQPDGCEGLKGWEVFDSKIFFRVHPAADVAPPSGVWVDGSTWSDSSTWVEA